MKVSKAAAAFVLPYMVVGRTFDKLPFRLFGASSGLEPQLCERDDFGVMLGWTCREAWGPTKGLKTNAPIRKSGATKKLARRLRGNHLLGVHFSHGSCAMLLGDLESQLEQLC